MLSTQPRHLHGRKCATTIDIPDYACYCCYHSLYELPSFLRKVVDKTEEYRPRRFIHTRLQAEELFEAAIAANPAHAESLGNLAVLLHGQPSTSAAMLDKIEALYKRAVHADPVNANNFSNFGLFLAEVIFVQIMFLVAA